MRVSTFAGETPHIFASSGGVIFARTWVFIGTRALLQAIGLGFRKSERSPRHLATTRSYRRALVNASSGDDGGIPGKTQENAALQHLVSATDGKRALTQGPPEFRLIQSELSAMSDGTAAGRETRCREFGTREYRHMQGG